MDCLRKSILYLLLMLGLPLLHAQIPTDSTSKKGLTYRQQVWIDSLCQFSQQVKFTNPDTAIVIGEQALALSKEYSYEEGQARALDVVGGAYWIKSSYLKAFDYYFQSLNIRERQGELEACARLHNKIGAMFENRGMLGKALDNFEKALSIYKDLHEDRGAAEALSYMGNNLSQQGEHLKALQLLEEGLSMREELGDAKEISRGLNMLGIAYERQGDVPQALSFFQRSLEIKKKERDLRGIGYNLNYMADLYVKMKDYATAIRFYKSSIDYKVRMKDNYGKLFSLLGLAKVYKKRGFNPGVINYGLQSYSLAKMLNAVNEIKEVAELLAAVYEDQEAYQRALFFQKEALEYSTLVNNEANIAELEALKYRHEMDRKNTENELLRKDSEIRDQHLLASQVELAKKKNTIFIISLFLICLILLLSVLFKYSREKRNANLEIQRVNAVLEQKVIDRTKQLKNQNEKLVEYAFFNAHKVRGPLARILGLVNIMDIEFKDDEKVIEFSKMMSESANELNDVVSEINQILEEEGLLSTDPTNQV